MKNAPNHALLAILAVVILAPFTCSGGSPPAYAEPSSLASDGLAKAPVSHAAEPIEAEPIEAETTHVAPWSAEAHACARLASNEAGLWSRHRPDIDTFLVCAVLVRFGRDDLLAYVASHHPRHTRLDRDDGNRWVAHLSTSLERPIGWPESRIPWESDSRGRAGWRARLDQAQAFLDAEQPIECLRAWPVAWGGPVTDHALLVSRLESGRYRIVAGPRIAGERPEWRRPDEQCSVDGETRARNVFLARVRELDEGR